MTFERQPMDMKNSARTIIAASLILILAGCSSDSDVNQAIDEINKLGLTNVFAANGTSQSIIAHLDGTGVAVPDNETITSFGSIILLSQFDTPDTYDLSYTIGSTVKGKTTIAKNSHILYAATECGGKEFFQHDLNGDDDVYIMNLTDTPLVTGILDITRDGAAVTTPDVAPCTTTAFNASSTDGQWRIDINGMNIIDLANFAGANSFVVLAVYDVTATSEAAELTFIAK